jgi:hypothetical protein
MPAYIKSPFKPVPALMVSGTASYLLGSWNDKTGDTLGFVISDSAVTTTGTLTFQIASGNIPIVGALITVVGTANASGNLNVTNVAIATVSTTATGVCTVTYTITSSTVAAGTPDAGQVSIPQPEVAEVLANGASFEVAMPFQNAQMNQEKTIVAVVSMPTLPTTATVTLQQAVKNQDSEYGDVATVASVAAGVLTGGQIDIDVMAGRFYRFNVSNVTGPAASIIAKLIA